MRHIFSAFLFCTCVTFFPFPASSETRSAKLPENCITGPREEIELHLEQHKAKIFSTAEEDGIKIITLITPSTDHIYIYLLGQSNENLFHLCPVGGGREPDVVMSRSIDWLAKEWPRNRNRYHPEHFERRHGFKFPASKLNDKIDFSKTVFALSFFSTGADFASDAYDEEWEIDFLDGAKLSRGEILTILIKGYATKKGVEGNDLSNETLEKYRKVLDGTDHQLPIFYLFFNTETRDWYMVAWHPKEERPMIFSQGTKIRFTGE